MLDLAAICGRLQVALGNYLVPLVNVSGVICNIHERIAALY